MTGIGECDTMKRDTDPMPGAQGDCSSVSQSGRTAGSALPPSTIPHDCNLVLAPFVPTIKARLDISSVQAGITGYSTLRKQRREVI